MTGFETFTRGARRVSGDPAATITKTGTLRLNIAAKYALEALAGRRVLGGDSLVLAWRADPRAIGVRVGRAADPDSAMHRVQSDGGSLAINAHAFATAHHLLGVGRSLRWPVYPGENEPQWLVIDLTKPGEDVTRTIRPRTQRTR